MSILAGDRPQTNAERCALWYAKAALVDGYLMRGPRNFDGFDWLRRREYEAEQIADGRHGFYFDDEGELQ